MKPKNVYTLLMVLTFMHRPSYAQTQVDVKTRVKVFCDTQVKLTEASIKFDVQSLLSIEAGNKSASTIGNVGTVQIATMHLNCSLLVGGFITP